MLASAHIQDVTLCWLVHTGRDIMLASTHKTGQYVGQCTYTSCVTICLLMHTGQDITLASAHKTGQYVGQCTYTRYDHMLSSAHRIVH
jgi:ribosomal protein S27AE